MVANVVLNRTKGQNSGWIVIAVGWGVAVTIAVYAVGRISGAHLNPAVTIGLASIGSFAWSDVPGYLAAQMVGGFIGAILVWLMYLPHWRVTADPGSKLGVFATGPAIRHPAANFVGEVIGTAVLVFGILAIAGNAQTLSKPGDVDLSVVFSRGLQPMLVGVLVLGIGLSLGGPTGYAINPARISRRASRTRCCQYPGRGARIGATVGFRWSRRLSAASSAPVGISSSGSKSATGDSSGSPEGLRYGLKPVQLPQLGAGSRQLATGNW